METIKIDIKRIVFNTNNPRSEIGDTSDLEASIKAHGLIQPIVVTYDVDKNLYEVVSGNRRLQAMKNIGATEIDAIVNYSDSEELFRIATAENLIRKSMSPADECRAVQQMVRNGGDIRSIATEFGHGVRWAMGRLKMADLGEEILEMVDDGDITLAHAEVLTMCRDDEEVKKFAESCRYTHPDELKKRILNEKKNLSRAPFDVKNICKDCRKQTVCQQDIFGDVSESYCEDGECFQKHLEAFLEAKRQELKKNGYREYEDHWEWGFRNSRNYIDPDRMSEADIETVERIKANGGSMWFMLEDNGDVIFRWCRADAPDYTDDEEEDVDDEREKMSAIRSRANELEKECVSERIREIIDGLGDFSTALIFDYINDNNYNEERFGEVSTADEDDDVDYKEGAVANIGERTASGKTQREFIVEQIIDNLFDYNGKLRYESEAERAFFGLMTREEYESKARKELE